MNTDEKEQCLLLDSKHIIATKNDKSVIPSHINNDEGYNIKLVDCGDYLQVYVYENPKLKKEKKEKSDLSLKKICIEEGLKKDDVDCNNKEENKIELRSIIRSKLECQRLAKANIKEWKTFITLTFKENITDVSFANKRFHYFINKIQRVEKNFKYIGITEFQKRGATHYHLLTNIDIADNRFIYSQDDYPEYKHVKYWIDGFTNVEIIQGDPKKIIGYIAKYMTKDIDNRLFNHRRYFYSRNLTNPKESFINTNNSKHIEFYTKKIQDCNLIYENNYKNPYDNTRVTFYEFFKK